MVARRVQPLYAASRQEGNQAPQPEPRQPTNPEPQETPEGHVQTLDNSTQAQAQGAPDHRIIHVPPPQPEVTLPLEAINQIIQLLRRQEHVNQARSFRYTQLEEQIAQLRAN